ncbi:MAG: TatD DNase family protein [Rhodothermales bacterium]|jgi:TatD DNase family protein
MRIWPQIAPQVVDTHCHLNLYPNAISQVAEFAKTGTEVIAVTTSPEQYAALAALTAPAPSIHAAVGLIPQDARRLSSQLNHLLRLLPDTRFVGEIGLDYVTQDPAERARQKRIFSQILNACSPLGDRVLSIHSRRASADTLAMLRDFRGCAILHWFSGRVREVERADHAWFSVNTAMVCSRRGRELVRAMNPDRILTETDGPFVTLGDRPVTSHDIQLVLEFLAREWRCDIAESAARVRANYRCATGR